MVLETATPASSSKKPSSSSSSSPLLPLTVVPTGAALGAEIKGLDLRDVLSSSEKNDEKGNKSNNNKSNDENGTKTQNPLAAAILDAWHDHGVLLFRGQHNLSPEQLLSFSREFGSLDLAPIQQNGRVNFEGLPELYVVSNVLDGRGEPIGALGHGEAAWHTDMSYLDLPPKASMLHAIEVPGRGLGNTSFACMCSAYESLPRSLKQRIKDLSVKHDATYNSGGVARAGIDVTDDPRRSPGAFHPLVVSHPHTGRECLYLGRRLMAWVEGLDLESSASLLDELWGYATADDVVWTHADWRAGDVVFWDNRSTLHRRDPFPAETRRIMHRTQIKGEAPPARARAREGVRARASGAVSAVSAVAAARAAAAAAAPVTAVRSRVAPSPFRSSSPARVLRRCCLVR